MTRDLETRLKAVEDDMEGMKLTLAELVHGGRIVAVSTPPPVAEEELTGSHAWRDRGRGGEDVPTPEGAIPADHTGRCPACHGAIRLGELIVKAPLGAENEFIAGRWCHADCAPEPTGGAA